MLGAQWVFDSPSLLLERPQAGRDPHSRWPSPRRPQDSPTPGAGNASGCSEAPCGTGQGRNKTNTTQTLESGQGSNPGSSAVLSISLCHSLTFTDLRFLQLEN